LNLTKQLIVISAFLIITILIGSTLFYLIDNDEISYQTHTTNILQCGEIEVNITNLETLKNIYKGDSLKFDFEITSFAFARIEEVEIMVSDGVDVYKKSHFLNLELSPNNPINTNIDFGVAIWDQINRKILVLDIGNYTIEGINVNYFSCFTFHTKALELDQNVTVMSLPLISRFVNTEWQINEDDFAGDDTISLTENSINISTGSTRLISNITTDVNFEGAMFLSTVYGLDNINSTVNLYIGEKFFNIDSLPTSITHDLQVMDIITKKVLILNLNISENSNFEIEFNMYTQKKVIFTAITEDGWSSSFQSASYYLNEASKHFEYTFNTTFIPVGTAQFQFSGGTDLMNFIEESELVAGEAFGLDNGTWHRGIGKLSANSGIDILITLTNRTMDYFGMVPGLFRNIASHAGGSLNAGGQRLSPAWADNLIQHEISHVFGALDHWTNEQDPSVLTKPQDVQDLFQDLARGTFWLNIHNWLEIDLVVMATAFDVYEGYIN
jgi:hypothetical protein